MLWATFSYQEGECGDDVVGLLERKTDEGWIFRLWRKEAKLSAREVYQQ